MPVTQTSQLGNLSYQPESVLEFPGGLPGFEERRRFLPLQIAESEPIVYLQSLEEPALCFITLPVLAVDPAYRLRMTPEDADAIGLPRSGRPEIGADVLCLAVVSVKESGPTANLLAPVVVNLANQRAVQAIAPGSDYSWEHPLLPAAESTAEAAACS